MFTTSGTYPWSFVRQIFHNCQPSHDGDRKTFEVKIVLKKYVFPPSQVTIVHKEQLIILITHALQDITVLPVLRTGTSIHVV